MVVLWALPHIALTDNKYIQDLFWVLNAKQYKCLMSSRYRHKCGVTRQSTLSSGGNV